MRKFGHKYRAKPVLDDGHRFRSTIEWKYFKHLESLKEKGDVVFFQHEGKFLLPGGVKYVQDFTVFYADGSCSFVDVKGVETDTFKIKRKIVEDLYPVEINIVKKGDF